MKLGHERLVSYLTVRTYLWRSPMSVYELWYLWIFVDLLNVCIPWMERRGKYGLAIEWNGFHRTATDWCRPSLGCYYLFWTVGHTHTAPSSLDGTVTTISGLICVNIPVGEGMGWELLSSIAAIPSWATIFRMNIMHPVPLNEASDHLYICVCTKQGEPLREGDVHPQRWVGLKRSSRSQPN